IRGTIGAAQVTPASADVILLGPGVQNNTNQNPGSLAVGNAGGSVIINTPGFGTTLLAGGPGAVVNMGLQAANILGLLGEQPRQGGPGASGGGPGASGGGQSASQNAGQDTAAGGTLANTSSDVQSFANTANTTQQVASQTETGSAVADGISQWSQVQSAFSGQTGYYSMYGDYTCTGGSCGSGTTVTNGLSASVDVDFGARKIVSGSVHLFSKIVDNATVAAQAFGTTGNATFAPDPAGANGGSFSGTTFSFMNSGGVAAHDMKIDLKYTSTSTGLSGTGSVTGGWYP
ncbi:MAG: hypothetical protein PHU21_06050, partial [Elusimicrobia bacterium]|nr:hypothetical protein [Elusimicrobiota bacterium]